MNAADVTSAGDVSLAASHLGASIGGTIIEVVGIYAETGDASTTGGPWTVTMQFYV